ncbi:TraX family protein [Clostridium sp. ZS1]|uniref:TraX family protein n=1 Tax=Clostridium sp. ZS1 TaxID=2949989 RepID=UPI0020799AF5|nr:TraX family protein [Clostridium sp. ZS1]
MFNSFQLKVIALIFMILDHIYTYMGSVSGVNIPIWFGYLGKLAAPIFFYLIVEGFFKTKSRISYMKRLFVFGIIMIFVDIIFNIHNNIFLSLGLAVALMNMMEYTKKCKQEGKDYWIGILCSVVIGILMIFTEASVYGLGMTLIFYFLKEKKILMSIAYILFSISPILSSLSLGEYFMESIFIWDYQWMMLFSIILILMYNGKLGLRNKFSKWMFYVIYPLHLIIIVLISRGLLF